uniref:hypothetical protein n=1 Tax=Promicromonospora sp. CA-289581 TaxID=3240013 RepID=UPI003F493E5F
MTQHPAETPRKARDGQMGLTFPQELDARARAVFRAQFATGEVSYSAFLVRAVLTYVAQLETEQNGGRRWPPVKASEMPRGGRGAQPGIAKKTVSTYPTLEEGDRIRGTAVGTGKPLGVLVTEAIQAAVDAAPPGDAGPVGRGRPIDSGPSFP